MPLKLSFLLFKFKTKPEKCEFLVLFYKTECFSKHFNCNIGYVKISLQFCSIETGTIEAFPRMKSCLCLKVVLLMVTKGEILG